MQKKIIFIIIFILSVQIFSTEKINLTIDKCIELCKENNGLVKEKEYQIGVMEGKLQEANSAYKPKFEGITFLAPIYNVEGDALNVTRDWYNWNAYFYNKLRLSTALYTFGMAEGLQNAAKHGKKVAQGDYKKVLSEQVYEVKKYYYSLLLARSLYKVVDELVEIMGKVQEKAEELLEEGSGDITEVDLAKLKLYAAEAELMFNKAEKSKELAFDALLTYIGVTEFEKYRIRDSKIKPVKFKLAPFENYLKKMFENRGEWQQLNEGIKAKMFLKEAEKSSKYPIVFAAGEFEYGIAPNRSDQDSNFAYDPYNVLTGGVAVGLKFDMDLFRTFAKVDQLQAEIDALKQKRKFAKDGFALELKNVYKTVVEYQKNLEVIKREKKAGRQWLMLTAMNYTMGIGKAKDALEGLGGYAQAMNRYYNQIFKYNMAIAELEKVTGTLLN